MLIGIEFKRRKLFDEENQRDVWFWRVALHTKGCDPTKLIGGLTFFIGMTALLIIGKYLQQ